MAANRPTGIEIALANTVISTVPTNPSRIPPCSDAPASWVAISVAPTTLCISVTNSAGWEMSVGRPLERTDHSTETSGSKAMKNAVQMRWRQNSSAASSRPSTTRVMTYILTTYNPPARATNPLQLNEPKTSELISSDTAIEHAAATAHTQAGF